MPDFGPANERSGELRLMKTKSLGVATSLICALAFHSGHVMAQDDDAQEEDSKFDYTVDEEGRVDEGVMMGFQVYTGSCMACHGPDGLGSSFAPSLIQAVERRTYDIFAQTIAGGRSLQPGMVMPAFNQDMRVMSHIEELWNYLGARSEGAIGRGRPSSIDANTVQEPDETEEENGAN